MHTQHHYKWFTIILCLAIHSLSAQTAYFPSCEPITWDGFYISGQLGGGGNREHIKFDNPNYFNTLGANLLGSHFNHNPEGFIAGGALGYNIQWDQLVLGVEGAAITTNLKETKRSPFFPDTDFYKTHLQCITSAKMRLGYAWGPLLVFINGGWAGGHQKMKLIDISNDISAHLKTWIYGWTAGAGFDCKFSPCISLGLAYDFTQLEYRKKTASCQSCGTGVGFGSPQFNDRCYIQSLTFRLNYYFN